MIAFSRNIPEKESCDSSGNTSKVIHLFDDVGFLIKKLIQEELNTSLASIVYEDVREYDICFSMVHLTRER